MRDLGIVMHIIEWLNEGDTMRGWGAYEEEDGWYLSYDHPYPMGRSYWKLPNP